MLPNTKLPIKINIDCLLLHKSERTSFWPILANIHTMPHLRPMIVVIFCGPKKPEFVLQYLRPLVDELNGLIDNGIKLGCPLTKVCIKVRAFVADSPARSFIKGNYKQSMIYPMMLMYFFLRCGITHRKAWKSAMYRCWIPSSKITNDLFSGNQCSIAY